MKKHSKLLTSLTPVIVGTREPGYWDLLERVAHLDVAALESALEPGDPLLRGSVREAIGRDPGARHALDAVITDRGGGIQPLFEVAGLELHLPLRGAAGLRRLIPPDARKTVGLQF